jgi:hypothetical protein
VAFETAFHQKWPYFALEKVHARKIRDGKFRNKVVRPLLPILYEFPVAIAKDPAKAQADVVDQIGTITGKKPKAELIATTFGNLTFTLDPIATSLKKSADDAIAVGLPKRCVEPKTRRGEGQEQAGAKDE